MEVMKGEPVALNCTALGSHDHFVLEWFLVSAAGWGPEGGQGGWESGHCRAAHIHSLIRAQRTKELHPAAFPFYRWGS